MVALCSSLLSTGFCSNESCTKTHDIPICRDCNLYCPSEQHYQIHVRGKRHRRQLAGNTVSLTCRICRIALVGQTAWAQHVISKKHKKNAAAQSVSPNVAPEEGGAAIDAQKFCALCKVYVSQDVWKLHPNSKFHQRKLRFGAIEAALEEAAKDKHGIMVSPNSLDFGVVKLSDATVGITMVSDIQSTVPLANVTMKEVKLSSATSKRSSPFTLMIQGLERRIIHSRGLKVTVTFKQQGIGLYNDRAEFMFEDTKLNQKFLIARALKAIAGDPDEYAAMQPKAPFVPRKRTERDSEQDIIPGDPPPATNAIKYVVPLGQYPIPPSISGTLNHGGSLPNIIRQFRGSVLPRNLDESTYGRHFKVLLWAEEHRSERDLEVYDIESATLNKHDAYYYLDVPGLAEKRPSVLVGDRILIQSVRDKEAGKWYEGCVHVVRRESVGMKLHRSFTAGYSREQLYRVRFKLNRFPLRRQHQGLDTAFSPERLLFPAEVSQTRQVVPSVNDIRSNIYNRLIANNAAQLQAVASVSTLPAGSPVFVIFGPPGTGKTVTDIECILQILRTNPGARILACAPSNSAADLIAQRLSLRLSPDELFRFYAPSRFKNQVPDELLPYTATTDAGHFAVPSMMRLKRFRVIVSTCVSASFAYGVGMPRGHFSHIFIDEAGQATEPEAMVGIKTIADNDTNVILSGDPKQLGPIIRSAVARELGLEKSYLERMMDHPLYDERRGYGITVVKLVQNFRSHPTILKYPNEKFYRGDLKPCGEPKVINAYMNSSILPNAKFPIIFHGVAGKDDREMSSPSFFNPLEALQVKEYVQQLRANRSVRISDNDIGVITPYNAQCRRIRMILKGVADEIKVGSVEEFQGQERRVIIISTVRSSREFVEYDLRHTLGFVANPRRFNVAVTRAQALLIVIGDPSVLSLDPLWRSFLNYIHINRGWRGEAPSWDTRAEVNESGGYDKEMREAGLADMNALARRLESFTLDGPPDETEEEDNVDKPWHRGE